MAESPGLVGSAAVTPDANDLIPCFLCGQGKLSRSQLLRDLRIKEMADILHLGVEDVLRKLDGEGLKTLQEVEKRLDEVYRLRFEAQQAEIEKLQKEIGSRETELLHTREELKVLEGKRKGTSAHIGGQGEQEFKSWAELQPRIECSEKLDHAGDYLVRVREDVNGSLVPIDTRILVDNKTQKMLTDEDLRKLVEDIRARELKIGMIVAATEEQLRKQDKEKRVREDGGVLIVISTMSRFLSDVELLSPLLRMLAERAGGATDFKARYQRVVRRVVLKLADLDAVVDLTQQVRDGAKGIDEIVGQFRRDVDAACREE